MKNKDFVTRIIRCKDCALRYTEDCPMRFYDENTGRLVADQSIDNGFCDYGEMKEERE